MATQRIELVTPNLVALGQDVQKHVLDGYTLEEGYPTLEGWAYVAFMSREVADAPVPPKAGRPKGSTKDILQGKYDA